VTFRKLAPHEIVALAEAAGLEAIEWGADVHLPPGDVTRAAELARLCEGAGLRCPSYGTYFFAGRSEGGALEPLLDSARVLGATLLRVWAPLGVESNAPQAERDRVAEALRDACERARAAGLGLALEFHPGTLTHTAASALDLLAAVGDAALRCYWQPESGAPFAHSLAELRAVLPRLAHLHVFAWEGRPPERLELARHEPLWAEAVALAAGADGFADERCAYLEFVADDDPARLPADAAALRSWIEAAAP
jgi:sugar phosphate isomerase/epimerase